MEIKVMQYNIKHGFHSENKNLDGSFDFYPERLEAAKAAVDAENPDVLVLNESSFSVRDKRESKYCEIGEHIDYKKTFSYPHIYDQFSHGWGTAILSRYPIISAENYSMHNRTFVKTQLDINGRRINLDIAHPHPELSEWEKMLFFKANLRDLQKPYLLVGDFNACSDEDKYNPEKLRQGFEGYNKEDIEKMVKNFMGFHAIPEIRRHGLIDSYIVTGKPFQYTVPTNLLSKNKNSGLRMDYIFCSQEFSVKDSYVVKNDLTEKASDHYPVVAVLEIAD